jgi:hypothetical protein
MMRRVAGVVAVAVGLAIGAAGREVVAQACYPTFGYGNVGYSAGYSFQQVGWCGPRVGGWCGPRWGGWCGPRWGGWGGGWCAPRWGGWCGPRWGWGYRPWGWRAACYPPVYSYGWPAWYGTGWYSSCDSVSLSTPVGGSFFSGRMVPFPAVGFGPVVVPGFAASGATTSPVANIAAARPALQQVAATIRDLRERRELARQQAAAQGGARAVVTARVPGGINRMRAARLVAEGDRHLRDANGDPVIVRRAADAYRRAASLAGDTPDTFIRQAIALVALDERVEADAALARAQAIDGRLADGAPPRDGQRVDPVFGDRPAGTSRPLEERGEAVLRQIAAQGGGDQAIAWLAGRWTTRFGGDLGAVAANGRRVK